MKVCIRLTNTATILALRGQKVVLVRFLLFIVSNRRKCQLSGFFWHRKILFLDKIKTPSNLKNTYNYIASTNFDRDLPKKI